MENTVSKTFKLYSETDFFGTKVYLQDSDNNRELLAENLTANPLEKMQDSINGGYMFRSPNIPTDAWADSLKSFGTFSSNYSLIFHYDEKSKKVTPVLRVEDQMDAAMFAWTNVEVWQKWSQEKEDEFIASKSADNKPTVFVDENGNLKATVTVTTLSDI